MKSKTIIISAEDKEGRGILTIYEEEDLLKCKLRLYNVEKLNRYCKLGIYHQKEVFSANLLEKEGIYISSMVGDFDMDKDFYAAIVDTSQNNKVMLSGGTYAGYFFNDNKDFEKENIFENIEKEKPYTSIYPKEYEEQETIEILDKSEENNKSENNKCEDCEKCKKCKYKEYFYSQNQENEKVENLSNQTIEKPKEKEIEQTKTLIESIVPQFDYVFNNYEEDKTLTSLIPNSKFVKINENQESYSIGAIYENEEMKYICYAIMKNYNISPPEELGEHYQWLPIDKEDPLSEGYYVVFQDAKDLKIVEL